MIELLFQSYFESIQYITFRAAAGAVTAFSISMLLAPLVIRWFTKARIQEQTDKVNSEKLAELHKEKQDTPSMGGLFFIGATIASSVLWTRLSTPLVWICLFVTLTLWLMGFLDDYRKLKYDTSHGLSIAMKLMGQCTIGLLAGLMIYMYSTYIPIDMTVLHIPLLQQEIPLYFGYPFFVMIMVVSTANAVNFSDGLDGLAIGLAILVALTYAVISYVTGRVDFSDYLGIMYIRGAGEISIILVTLVGASLGFLWYNCHPAQIFMGDTGSLPLGGLLGITAALSKQEILLILTGGVFVLEALSVLLQIATVRLFNTRIFRIAPLHHHFQFKGWNENKIVIRFWILATICLILSLSLLKIGY